MDNTLMYDGQNNGSMYLRPAVGVWSVRGNLVCSIPENLCPSRIWGVDVKMLFDGEKVFVFPSDKESPDFGLRAIRRALTPKSGLSYTPHKGGYLVEGMDAESVHILYHNIKMHWEKRPSLLFP